MHRGNNLGSEARRAGWWRAGVVVFAGIAAVWWLTSSGRSQEPEKVEPTATSGNTSRPDTSSTRPDDDAPRPSSTTPGSSTSERVRPSERPTTDTRPDTTPDRPDTSFPRPPDPRPDAGSDVDESLPPPFVLPPPTDERGLPLSAAAAGMRIVPSLAGREPELAAQMLRLADLRMVSGPYFLSPQHWSKKLEEGVIYMQSPQADLLARSGDVVACWTFAPATEGHRLVDTPSLIGRSAEEASQLLQQAGLLLLDPHAAPADAGLTSPATADAATEARMIVIDQYPRAGQKIYEGTAVLVAWGPLGD